MNLTVLELVYRVLGWDKRLREFDYIMRAGHSV